MSQNTKKHRKSVYNTQLKRRETVFEEKSGNYAKNEPKIAAFMYF